MIKLKQEKSVDFHGLRVVPISYAKAFGFHLRVDYVLPNIFPISIDKLRDLGYLHVTRSYASNDTIIGLASIPYSKRREFVENIVGYKPGKGDFPEVKSLEDLEKVLNRINELIIGEDSTPLPIF